MNSHAHNDMGSQLTFRERQLINAFRGCDERGRVLLESLAIDQASEKSATKLVHMHVVGARQ